MPLKYSSSRAISVAIGLSVLTIIGCATRPASAQDTNQMPALKPEVKANLDAMRTKYANSVKGVTQQVTPPSGFPVPIYTSQQVSTNFARSNNNASNMAGMITTKDQPSLAYNWYLQQLRGAGWTLASRPQSAAEKAGKVYSIEATKGDTSVMVNVAAASKFGMSMINISVFPEPKPPAQK